MNIFKKVIRINRILKAYKGLKELAENNKNYSDDVKAGFDLIKQGAEKLVNTVPALKEAYLDAVEILKDAE